MADIEILVYEKIDLALDLCLEKQHRQAIDLLVSVFNELDRFAPDKYSLDLTFFLINTISDQYVTLVDYQSAKLWIQRAFSCSGFKDDANLYFKLGKMCFELKQNTEAYHCFLNAFQQIQYRVFADQDPKYWHFFKKTHHI